MASISDGDGDDTLVLRCIDTDTCVQGSDIDEDIIVISVADIDCWDLPLILSHRAVEVRANRSRLIEQSSYFKGLLGGNFSESSLDCLPITWNLESLFSVLMCIFGCPMDVNSNNFITSYEAALFFGVESLLLKCRIWLTEVTAYEEQCFPQLQVADVISIWKFSVGHADDLILNLCTSYLARNFMWVISNESFNEVPYDFLVSCIKHPHLTVESEKHLCDAVLQWVAANKSSQSLWSTDSIFGHVWLNN